MLLSYKLENDKYDAPLYQSFRNDIDINIENKIIKLLDYKLYIPTVITYIDLLSIHLNIQVNKSILYRFIIRYLYSTNIHFFKPSYVALTILFFTLKTENKNRKNLINLDLLNLKQLLYISYYISSKTINEDHKFFILDESLKDDTDYIKFSQEKITANNSNLQRMKLKISEENNTGEINTDQRSILGFSPKILEILENLGEGTFAKVYKVKYNG